MIFSESRSYKNKNMLRKEYIQQNEKETIKMGLFPFMLSVQFLNLSLDRNQFGEEKSHKKEKKGVQKNQLIDKSSKINRKTVIYI